MNVKLKNNYLKFEIYIYTYIDYKHNIHKHSLLKTKRNKGWKKDKDPNRSTHKPG